MREWFGVQSDLFGKSIGKGDVFSLIYINPETQSAMVQRFIPAQAKIGYHVYQARITLEQATSLAENSNEFKWWEPDETEPMRLRLQMLTEAYEKEVAIQEEEQRRDAETKIALQTEKVMRQKVAAQPTRPTFPSIENASTMEYLDIDTIHSIRLSVGMDVADASKLYRALLANKHRLPNQDLESIRQQARMVLGPIKKPNPISPELREQVINIALI